MKTHPSVQLLLIAATALLAGCAGPRQTHVILCDRSGSMLVYGGSQADEAARIGCSIPASGDVNVGLALEPGVIPLFSRPQPATAHRGEIETFLQSRREFQGDGMIEGIGWAIAQRPDTVWLLSDGDVNDLEAVGRLVERARSVCSFELRAVHVGDPDDITKEWREWAARHAGGLRIPKAP